MTSQQQVAWYHKHNLEIDHYNELENDFWMEQRLKEGEEKRKQHENEYLDQLVKKK